jgi:hypothetical protein
MRHVPSSRSSRNPHARSPSPGRIQRATLEVEQKLFASAARVAYHSPEDASVLLRAGSRRTVRISSNIPDRLVIQYPAGLWPQKGAVST